MKYIWADGSVTNGEDHGYEAVVGTLRRKPGELWSMRELVFNYFTLAKFRFTAGDMVKDIVLYVENSADPDMVLETAAGLLT